MKRKAEDTEISGYETFPGLSCTHDFLIVLALILADASIHVQNRGLCGGSIINEDAKTHSCNIVVCEQTTIQPPIPDCRRGYPAYFGGLDGFRDRQVPFVSLAAFSNRRWQIRRGWIYL